MHLKYNYARFFRTILVRDLFWCVPLSLTPGPFWFIVAVLRLTLFRSLG